MTLDLPKQSVAWLISNIDNPNIADDLDENALQKIGADVVAMYDYDKASRSDWEEKIEQGIKTAKQVVEEKTYPHAMAANTKDSLMAEASAQFAARAGGEVVRGQDVVKIKVTGSDPDELKEKRAKRVSTYMSYDCTDGMEEWESENDQLLTSLSLIGMYYKKTFRDEMRNVNVSYARSPLHVVVNEDAKTLQTAPRITEEMDFTTNDVIERVRKGLWLDATDKMEKDQEGTPEMFLEQHRRLDLDGDGYEEPYIVVVHKESQAVCRIAARYDKEGVIEGKKGEVARIEPNHYFTEFPFLLSPDGKFHKIGWAHLLGPNTEVINTIVNQLLDAGHMANCPPIFVGKGAKLPAGGLRVSPGRTIPVESTGQALKDNVYVMPTSRPSDVLFKLLGLLNDKGQKLANLSDSMQGETGGANVPATTTLALLDQALKVYTSILKRLFRSYKQEFQKLYKLDRQYLTDKEYINVIDITPEDLQGMQVDVSQVTSDSRVLIDKDFSELDKDIQPVMDPTASSAALRLALARAKLEAADLPPAFGRMYLEDIGVPQKDIDILFPPVDPNAPKPIDPALIEAQAKILDMQHKNAQKDRELDQKHAALEQKEAELIKKLELIDAQIANTKAGSIQKLADAEAKEVGTQIGVYETELNQLNADRDHELAKIQTQISAESAKEGNDGTSNAGPDTGATKPVDDATNNQEGNGVLQTQGAGSNTGLGAGQLSAGNFGADSAVDHGTLSPPASVQSSVQPTQLPAPGPMQ
jgi:hypothetical protein